MLNNQRPEWAALAAHAHDIQSTHLRDIMTANSGRADRMSVSLPGLYADYTRQPVTDETIRLLCDLARACDVTGWRDRMFAGDAINTTEDRAVLHTALRRPAGDDVRVDGKNIMPFVHDSLNRMRDFCESIHDGSWTGYNGKPIDTIINIGIGGSDLGPAMVVDALRPFHQPGIHVKFVSNVDGAHLYHALNDARPDRTLFLIASKTFTTQETMENARSARQWIIDAGGEGAVAKHFVALSTNGHAVTGFGIESGNMFEFRDWVGGRYSLWSAIGMSIALAVGFDNFRNLLDGAHAMDTHFRTAPMDQNLPVLLGMIGVWNRNFLHRGALAVLPYDQNLARFPAFLQQLDMESNGKRVSRDGDPLPFATGPIVFGEPGTNGQHAFYQWLHQGPEIVPADFIGCRQCLNPLSHHHRILLANMVAQAQAMMTGRTQDESHGNPHQTFPGNRPSTTILLDMLDPFNLGQLIALYEHRVFVQGIIWGINSFDQYGVELGKILAGAVLDAESGAGDSGPDPSARAILARISGTY